MRLMRSLCSVSVCLALGGSPVWAADPAGAGTPQTPQAPAAAPPVTEAFAQAPEAGTEAPTSFNPTIMGDSIIFAASALRPSVSGGRPSPSSSSSSELQFSAAQVRIADDNTPRPQTRLHYDFNYYNNLPGGIDLYRHTLGWEQAFGDGAASVEVRVPLNRVNGGGIDTRNLGDLAAIGKFVLSENEENGSLLSAGMLVTAPTNTGGSWIDTVFLQPFVGWILNGSGDFYAQGFTAGNWSTNGSFDASIFNDVQVGYWLRRDGDGVITGIIPTFEVHVLTPIENRSANAHIVDLTGGTTLELNGRSTLAVGVNVPITGPSPYDIEALAQFNLRF